MANMRNGARRLPDVRQAIAWLGAVVIFAGACPALAVDEITPAFPASITGMPRHVHGAHGTCNEDDCCDLGVARNPRPAKLFALPAVAVTMAAPADRGADHGRAFAGERTRRGPPGASTPLLR